MSLLDLIMSRSAEAFSRKDWAALGRGEIQDAELISEMLREGYGGMVDE